MALWLVTTQRADEGTRRVAEFDDDVRGARPDENCRLLEEGSLLPRVLACERPAVSSPLAATVRSAVVLTDGALRVIGGRFRD